MYLKVLFLTQATTPIQFIVGQQATTPIQFIIRQQATTPIQFILGQGTILTMLEHMASYTGGNSWL